MNCVSRGESKRVFELGTTTTMIFYFRHDLVYRDTRDYELTSIIADQYNSYYTYTTSCRTGDPPPSQNSNPSTLSQAILSQKHRGARHTKQDRDSIINHLDNDLIIPIDKIRQKCFSDRLKPHIKELSAKLYGKFTLN